MKLVYFSWVREKIGTPDEELNPPNHINTVSELINWLTSRGEGYASAFADLSSIRIAITQEYAKQDAAIRATDEIAFFPPVTGG